jgi:hypothetical protein
MLYTYMPTWAVVLWGRVRLGVDLSRRARRAGGADERTLDGLLGWIDDLASVSYLAGSNPRRCQA